MIELPQAARSALWSLLALCAHALLMPTSVVAQVAPLDLDGFRGIVRQQERSVALLRGRGLSVLTRRGPGGEERLGETTARFVFETKPGGRFRIDTEPECTPWHVQRGDNGPKCFIETHDSRGFDGRVSWLWHRSWMEEGKPGTRIEKASASVEAKRNHLWQHCPPTGWRRTLPGFYSERAMSFTEGLEVAAAPFALQWRAGDETLVVSLPSRDGLRVERWFLRKQWAYCLARYEEREVASDALVEAFDVLEAVRLHEAFWYPTHIKGERVTPQGTLHLEVHVAEIASAAADSAEFEPRFPAGTLVSDLLTGEQVRISAPEAVLAAQLGRQSAQLRDMVLYEPANSLPWGRMLIAILAGSAGILLLLRHRARGLPHHRPKGGTPSCMLALVVAAAPVATASPCIAQEVRPLAGGVLCSYRVRWDGRPGVLEATVRDAGGQMRTVMARLSAVHDQAQDQGR